MSLPRQIHVHRYRERAWIVVEEGAKMVFTDIDFVMEHLAVRVKTAPAEVVFHGRDEEPVFTVSPGTALN